MDKMKKRVSIIVVFILFLSGILTTQKASASISDKKISLMGIEYSDGGDRTSWIAPSAISVAGVGNTSVSKFIDFDVTDILNQLYNQDMVVIHTHGAQNSILTYKNGTENILTSAIINSVFNVNAFSKLRICFIGACSCGAGGSSADNFVNMVYEHGALCVIGYKQSVNTSCNRLMLQQFCYYIGSGYTVQNALAKAEQDVYNKYGTYGNVNDRLVRGLSGIAMTDNSYRVMGTSTYSLVDYNLQTLNIPAEEIVFLDESSIGLQSGDMYSFDENNQIYSYVKLELGDEQVAVERNNVNTDDFFTVFNLEGYELEITEYDNSEMHCMRGYVNDIKTNDIIYYIVDNNNDLVAYGYPRVGTASDVRENFGQITKSDVMCYIQNEYNISEIEDIIIDVDNPLNPYINISYNALYDGYESIETISVPLSYIAERI